MKNLWLLTEERPKLNVVKTIVERFCADYQLVLKIGTVKIEPILENKKFTFTYEVTGLSIDTVGKIFIKTVSGDSSFVDYLVFLQESKPDQTSKPLYAIEETKTDDSESRNTGVYQRCSKFVFVDFFYPGIKKIMLYNLQIKQKEQPTLTSIFGTRMLRTIGVEIMGKKIDDFIMKPFESTAELIDFKEKMPIPHSKDNVPIKIKEYPDKITISGKLFKNEALAHDPNIGALSIIALCLRQLKWEKEIVIVLHGLSQDHVGVDNKFIKICNRLNISLEGLAVPIATNGEIYWHYETSSEKLASIFTHLVVERYTNGKAIYENHAGSERGYLFGKNHEVLVIPKYQEGKQAEYKLGNKTLIVSIPDLIIYDPDRNEIIDIEAKKYTTRVQGIADIKNYDYLEEHIIKPLYDPVSFTRTVVIFGSSKTSISEPEISLLLNENGEIILGSNPPTIIKEAVENLLTSQ